MSSTNRGSRRNSNDAYYTPWWCVHRLLEAYSLPGGLWVEPCVGSGSIVHAVNNVRNDIIWETSDIVASVYAQKIGDARDYAFNSNAKVIITNPPFYCAQEIVERCLRYLSLSVFLQRLNWGAGPRANLFRQIQPSVYVLPNRPSFTDDGKTDSIEYAWFVFDGKGKFSVLADTPLEERKRR